MEFDVIKAKDIQTLVNTVQDYVKTGWVLKGELSEKDGNYTQQVERRMVNDSKRAGVRQKSWIAWPAIKA